MRLNLLAHTSSEQRAARTRKLTDIREGSIPTAVFDVLRWIIASNTSYLREIEDPAHQVQGVPPTTYRQFLVRPSSARRSLTTQFVSGSPEKETKLRAAIQAEQVNNANARTFPTLFAWHGSGLRNWHSILRVGLHFQKVRLCPSMRSLTRADDQRASLRSRCVLASRLVAPSSVAHWRGRCE